MFFFSMHETAYEMRMSDWSSDVCSSDLARAFLAERGPADVRFVAGDVETLPFRAGAFDVVTCRIAAHNFANVWPAVRPIAATDRTRVETGQSVSARGDLGGRRLFKNKILAPPHHHFHKKHPHPHT